MSRGVKSLLIFLTASLLLLSACGLYSYPYISAPDLQNGTASTAQPNVTIIHNGDNDPNVFQGYEIYYKFYNKTSAYDDHRRDHNNIFSIKEPDYTALVAAGYKRCKTIKLQKEDTKYPMLPVPVGDRDSDFKMTLSYEPVATNIEPNSKQELTINYLSDSVPIYRQVIDTDPDSGEVENAGGRAGDIIYKDFNSDDLKTQDSDMPDLDVSLSFYIIAFGKHENHNLYSKPVWLGYVDVMR